MDKNSKIFLAGHNGLAGSAILRKLKSDGFTNIITRNRADLDLFNQKAVNDFFESEKPEYVIIAAARVGGIKANMTYPAEFLYENLEIQNNLIWGAFKHDVKKLLFLGSSCIYPREASQPIKEEYLMTGPLEPTNEAYAVAKIAGLKQCEYIFSQYGRKFISCMPCNLYGPGDHFGVEASHVVPALLARFHDAKVQNQPEVVIWGTGNAKREFLYVDDLADAVLWLMNNYEEKQFLNLGTGVDMSIKDLAILMKEVTGYQGELKFDATKPDGMMRKVLDVTKINQAGWKAKVSAEDGLRQTYDWFLKNAK